MAPLPMAPGKYTTRSSRAVILLGSRLVEKTENGVSREYTVWDGELYKADGVVVDSRHTWDAAGKFINPQGTINAHDLVSRLDPMPKPDPAEHFDQLHATIADQVHSFAAKQSLTANLHPDWKQILLNVLVGVLGGIFKSKAAGESAPLAEPDNLTALAAMRLAKPWTPSRDAADAENA